MWKIVVVVVAALNTCFLGIKKIYFKLVVVMDCQRKVIVTCTVVSLGTLAFWLWYRKNRKEEIPKNWRLVGKVSDLHLYPLKSGKRIEVKEAECDRYGLVQITDKAVHKLVDR